MPDGHHVVRIHDVFDDELEEGWIPPPNCKPFAAHVWPNGSIAVFTREWIRYPKSDNGKKETDASTGPD